MASDAAAVHARSEPGDREGARAAGIREPLRELRPYFRAYRGTVVLIGLGLLVEAAFNAFLPLSFSFLIDKALIPKDKQMLVFVLAALAVGVVVAGVVGIGRDRLYAQLASNVIADLRMRLFDHLQTLSIGFFSRTQLGDILTRFSGDLVAVETAFASALAWAVAPALDICVFTVLLFVLDWRLALVAMLVWPVALLGPRRFAPRAVASSYRKKELEAGCAQRRPGERVRPVGRQGLRPRGHVAATASRYGARRCSGGRPTWPSSARSSNARPWPGSSCSTSR